MENYNHQQKQVTFVGWYDSNNNKIEITTTVDITENKTLTAQWQIMKRRYINNRPKWRNMGRK